MTPDPFASLAHLSAALARGEATAQSLAASYLDRIRRANGRLNAFIHVDEDIAQHYARAADERRAMPGAGLVAS